MGILTIDLVVSGELDRSSIGERDLSDILISERIKIQLKFVIRICCKINLIWCEIVCFVFDFAPKFGAKSYRKHSVLQ